MKTKNVLKTLPAIMCLCGMMTTATAQQGAEYKIGVSFASSLMPLKERYVLELAGSEQVTMDADHKTVYFSKKLRTGDAFKVRIISSPRPGNLTLYGGPDSIAQGIAGSNDILISFYCTPPPLTIVKLNITGVENGENFSFADKYGRTKTVSFSVLSSMGGFPVGDPLMITQTAGPRPCVLTPASGTVPASPLTIQCDCRKKAVNNTPPADKYDLVTRSTDNKVYNTYYESGDPVIGGSHADEGRYVAFWMYGKGIDGSTGKYRQVYWRDRKTGTTKMISRNQQGEEGNGNSANPAISADGQTVVFETYATNLGSADNNGVRDVYVWTAATGQLQLVSRTENGTTANSESYEPVVSANGNVIAYTSNASNIVTLQPVYSTPNVYVYNRQTGSSRFITKDYETGKAAGGYAPSISGDGRRIAFCAYTYRLTENDNNNLWDIFLWEDGAPGLKRISMTAGGGERNQGDESSSRVVWPSISGDGNVVAFATTSTNIVADDKNGLQDVFVYHIPTAGIKRVSVVNGSTEGDGNSPTGQGERIGISYDGQWVAYNTSAGNLGTGKGNIVKQHTVTGTIIPVTAITAGSTARPAISAGGNYVIAGCSQAYDKRFSSSGIFVFYTGN